MTGKDKCEFLREIRKNMAEANGIPYEPRECNYEGDCSGTCPFCEREAADLMTKLREKEARGEKIEIDEACTTIFDREKMKALKMEVEEYITPIGKIRCDDDDNKKRRDLEIKEMERINRDQMTPLMGDIDFEYGEIIRKNEEAEKKSRWKHWSVGKRVLPTKYCI